MNLTEHISHSNFPVCFTSVGLFAGSRFWFDAPFMFWLFFDFTEFWCSCFARKCLWSWLSVRKFSGHESQRNISWFPLETELLSSSKISIFSIWPSYTQMLRKKFSSRAVKDSEFIGGKLVPCYHRGETCGLKVFSLIEILGHKWYRGVSFLVQHPNSSFLNWMIFHFP